MSWKSYIYPQIVARYSSKYNSDIRIVETFGKYKLLVNGSPQSGPYIKSLWNRILTPEIFRRMPSVQKILVLGVGGGTVFEFITRLAPEAQVTAVDIDALIIDIGKKYFSFHTKKNLQIIRKDASAFVQEMADMHAKFDVIIADLFIGRHIPEFTSSDSFLGNLDTILSKDGRLIINYLREKEYKSKSDKLLDKLQKIYHSVIERRIFLNRFFICHH